MDRAGVECGCGWEANGIRVRVSSAAAACGWEARRMGLGLGAGRGRGGVSVIWGAGEEPRRPGGEGAVLGPPACLPACGPCRAGLWA